MNPTRVLFTCGSLQAARLCTLLCFARGHGVKAGCALSLSLFLSLSFFMGLGVAMRPAGIRPARPPDLTLY